MLTWNLDFAAFVADTDQQHWFAVTDPDRVPLRAYQTLQNAANHGPADLWLEMDLLDPIILGQEFRYAIRYTNLGGRPGAGVVMTDTLPAGTEYVADSGGGLLNGPGDHVIWDLGSVDPCTYETITLTLRLVDARPPGGVVSNQVEARQLPGEPYVDDNVATGTTVLPIPPGLAIQKGVVPEVAAPGEAITYTLVFSNTGADPCGGVFITDLVPTDLAQLDVVAYGAAVTQTQPGVLTYTWQVQELGPGQGGTITIQGTISPGLCYLKR
jgi:uncharacterized repeat protein (TIGR01451 family)